MTRQHSLSREETEVVMKKGDFISSPFFSGRKMASNKGFKASVVAPKKVFKLAVDRNKAKRRFRASFMDILEEITGKSMVFFLKKPTIDAPLEEIRQSILKIAKK